MRRQEVPFVLPDLIVELQPRVGWPFKTGDTAQQGGFAAAGRTKHGGDPGGGHLELKSIALAREQLARSGAQAPHSVRFPLGPALGQCCGGVAYIRFDLCRSGIVPADVALPDPEPLFHLMLFGAGHVAQALVQVLAELSNRSINMTRVESRPSRQALGVYVFLVDIQGHREDDVIAEALAAVEERSDFFRVLGSYPRFPS